MANGNPTYLWWNGEQVKWDDATVHVTALGWSTVGAVFEGIRAYWNADEEELYVFRLEEHMRRFDQSMKMVRLDSAWKAPELIDAIEGGQIAFTIDQQQYLQGYVPVLLLYLYVTNQNTLGGGQSILTGPGFVTPENAAEVKALVDQGTR